MNIAFATRSASAPARPAPRLLQGARNRSTSLRAVLGVLLAGIWSSAAAVPTCTVATGAMLDFGVIAALASTADVTTNSGSSFWVNCTSDVGAAPALYSGTARTLVSGGASLPFALSTASPGGLELPSHSPGTALGIARNGSNQTVTLYGKVLASNFRSLSPGVYASAITLTIEY